MYRFKNFTLLLIILSNFAFSMDYNSYPRGREPQPFFANQRPISIPYIIEGSTILSLSWLIITQAPELYEKIQNNFRKKYVASEPIKLTEPARKILAYHEAGHALICVLMPDTHDHLKKISIIPGEIDSYGGVNLGYTKTEPADKKYTYSKEELITHIMTSLGGTVAEEIVFDTVTTGATDDLARVTTLIGYMLCDCGMSNALGKMSYRYTYCQKTAERIEAEAEKIITDCYNKTKKLLIENRDKLNLLADTLLEKETLEGKEVYELLGITIESTTDTTIGSAA